jgi:hypothetical protein
METIDSIFGPTLATGATRWTDETLSGGGETQA